jgi:hypothetical protein
MTTLPETTLARLQWRAESGDHEAKALLHLIARADARDQDAARFVGSYSSTIPVANALTVAEAALADVAEGEPVSPRADDRLHWAETRCTEALAAIRPVMKEHGIRTSEWPAAAPAPAPTPSAALQRLIEAPIDARGYVDLSERKPAPGPTPPPAASAGELLEKVASGLGPATQAAMEGGTLPYGIAYAAISEVAAWLDTRGHHASANVVRRALDR